MENSKPKHTKQELEQALGQAKTNNDWTGSEGNTETKYTDTNDMTRNR